MKGTFCILVLIFLAQLGPGMKTLLGTGKCSVKAPRSYTDFLFQISQLFPSQAKRHAKKKNKPRDLSQQVNIYQAMTIEKRKMKLGRRERNSTEFPQNKTTTKKKEAHTTIWITNNSYFDL